MVLLLSHCFTTTRNNRKRIGCYRLMSLLHSFNLPPSPSSPPPSSLRKSVYVQLSSVWTSGRSRVPRTIPRVGRKKLSHRASSSLQLFQFESSRDEVCHFWKSFSGFENDLWVYPTNFLFFFFVEYNKYILSLIDDRTIQSRLTSLSIRYSLKKKETIHLTCMEK